jgi:hypothetical protein
MRREIKIARLKAKNWRKWVAENCVPVSKHEIIMNGHVGSFMGVNIISQEIPLQMYLEGKLKYLPRPHGFKRTRTRGFINGKI